MLHRRNWFGVGAKQLSLENTGSPFCGELALYQFINGDEARGSYSCTVLMCSCTIRRMSYNLSTENILRGFP